MASYPELKEFDALLSQVVDAKKLSASKMGKLTDMALELIENDTYLVTSLYRLHRNLAPSSPQKIYSLYCFDSIARACRSKVKKGIGAKIEKKGTFAGFLQQMEGILDGLVEDLVAKREVDWPEGREKTKKILDIWTKGLTFPPEVLKRVSARVAAAIADAPAPTSTLATAPVASSSSSSAVNGSRDTSERPESSDQSKKKSSSPPNSGTPTRQSPSPTDPRRPRAAAPVVELKPLEAVAPPPSSSTPPLPLIPAGLLALLQNATGGGSPRSAGPDSQSSPSTPNFPPSIAPSSLQQLNHFPPAPPQPVAPTSTPLPLTLDASALALLTQLTSQPSFQQPQFNPPPPAFPPQLNSYHNYPPPPPTLSQSFANGRPPPPLATRVYNAYDGTFKEPGPPPPSSFPLPLQQAWRPPAPNESSTGWDQPLPRSHFQQASPPPPQSYHQQPLNLSPSRSPVTSTNGLQGSPPRRDQFQQPFDASRGPPPQRQGGGWADQNGYDSRGNWDTTGGDGRASGSPRGGGDRGAQSRGGGAGGFGGPAAYERAPREFGRRGFESNGPDRGYGESRRSSGGDEGRGGGAAGRGGRGGGGSGGGRWDVPAAQSMRDGRSPPLPSNYNGQHQPPAVPFPPPPHPMVSPSSYVRQLPVPQVASRLSPPPPRQGLPPPSSQNSMRPFIHPSRLGLGQGDVRPPVDSRPSESGLDEFGRAIRQTSADIEDEEDQGPPRTRARLSEGGAAAIEPSSSNEPTLDASTVSTPSSSSLPVMPSSTSSSSEQSNKRKSRASSSPGPRPTPTDPAQPHPFTPLPPPTTSTTKDDPLAAFNWAGFDHDSTQSWESLATAYYQSKGVAPKGNELHELARAGTGGGV